ncbi:AAA family ATPase [Bradyrhizobium lablabi]|uniref:AAA family ATPase n=1 Tax=Bradyrhizobium lablabi TaxID=722472 RepID=UPI001BA98975|nr:AAA family ATPase [Bradyrhizobium lablabi]MBR1124517.1 AAA family ATPase [Bradyrhizobium lablabi]
MNAPIIMPLTFEALWQLGYRNLLPIIPPKVEISEHSTLFKRIDTTQDGRGKTPGVCGTDGKWRSFDWIKHETTLDDLARWQRMGASIGVKMGFGLAFIDADTLNKTHAGLILTITAQKLGKLPCRIGNYPKAGYLCRITGPMKYVRLDFGDNERVEILTEGRQAVFAGLHPKTDKIYTWPFPLVPFNQLPVFTPQQLVDLLNELRSILPAAKPIVTEGATTTVDQKSLKGDLETVRKAVTATPNTSEAFSTRESWRDFGYAIKGALQDHPEEAFEIFSEWSARWTENGKPVEPGNTPDYIEAEWKRFKPPFRVGASKIYELAEQHAPKDFRRVDLWFDEVPDEPQSLFAPPLAPATTAREVEPLIIIDPTAWSGQQARPREWIVDGWMPKDEVTLLYGDGGVGKSLLAMQFATCAATGRPWLGQATQPSRVMGFFCEDSEDELLRRQIDINRALGVDFTELTGLRFICRKHSDNVFALWDRQTGALKLQPVWHQLVAAAKEFDAGVVIVDTIADVYAGSEIDRVQVNAFVKGVLGRLGKEIGATVLALGHPSVAGKQSGEGTSGSTAWNNAVRSRLYLKHPKGAEGGNTRVLEGRKSNYGPKGSQLIVRYNRGAFEMLAGSQPAAQRDGTAAAPEVVSIGEAAERAVVSVLMAYPNERLSMASNSQYYAVKVLRGLDPEGFAPFPDDKVVAAIRNLERREAIREQRVGSTEHGRAVHGYVVVPEKIAPPPTAEQPAAVFD